ncbi:SGNH/GDSL hydrolase family protein [Nocardiopsis sp. RSe5-2]|uniref:SGNH/GDSL hydrolase family protein n=1 Tax=Nocardiopsis endophytica TaxID=3018445 RepID=A0ABT4U4H1_9ACTN|nr:SGNH/GDSL hydrolase family protein [Nocardiopsis endophytica]MDA2811227.1 SGNH/GDSL hydrolase family protein [Nocardiopsis endophytica]
MHIKRSAALAAAVLLAAAACSSEESGGAPEERYYLSLGDSLAVGVQPDGEGGFEETTDGYTDALYRTLKDGRPSLRHERMGCGGEDTTTFKDGGLELCGERYTEGTQLAQAERFLEEHRGQVDLVTIDIGGNNFTGCVDLGGGGPEAPEGAVAEPEESEGPEGSEGSEESGDSGNGGTPDVELDRDCVEDGLDRLEEEVPEITSRLRAAAGPDVQIIGMTYYNPFLAAMLLEDSGSESDGDGDGDGGDGDGGDGGGDADSPADDELVDYATDVLLEMNDILRSSYSDADMQVADVEEAFESQNFEESGDGDSDMPTNVQYICDYTWMCNTQDGPDIHTNQAGAQHIARTFERLVEAG